MSVQTGAMSSAKPPPLGEVPEPLVRLRRRALQRGSAPANPPASHRDELLERLHNLRTIVPVFAEELASARRQAASLRTENRRLTERIRELQREREAHRRPRPRGLRP